MQNIQIEWHTYKHLPQPMEIKNKKQDGNNFMMTLQNAKALKAIKINTIDAGLSFSCIKRMSRNKNRK